MNRTKLGPQTSDFLKNPQSTLDNWQGQLSDIQSRHRNFTFMRAKSPEAVAAFADLLPLRFVANAYLAKKTADIFVRDNPTDIPLAIPSPYSFRASKSSDGYPYSPVELGVQQAMWQSAKKLRHSHQYDFEPEVVKFADQLNAIDFRLRGNNGAPGWHFEDHTIWRGNGTATSVISAFLGAAPLLLEKHRGTTPTNQEIYETVQASHRVPLLLAATNIPTVAFANLVGLDGDNSTLTRTVERSLVVAEHKEGVPIIEFSEETRKSLAKERDWKTPSGTPVAHMGCLALARMPDLTTDWREQPNPPMTTAIDQQISWMAGHWRDNGLWEKPVIEDLRGQSVIRAKKAAHKPLALSALHGVRSVYISTSARVATALR